MSNKIKIGITHGDINGISYEVIIRGLLDKRILDICTPIIYGSPKVAAYHRKTLNIEGFNMNNIVSANQARPGKINIIDLFNEELKVELGQSTKIAGQASLKALESCTEDLKSGLIDAMVTAPINKDNIQSEDFHFPGHTEYLKDRFASEDVLMILLNDNLRVGVVTGHVPVQKVPDFIKKETILNKISILNESLKKDFGIRKPRIAVLGLNPHAGDNGLIGKEEIIEIIPAMKEAKNKGIITVGPLAADGLFGSGEFLKYDAILAMYHDQGLAPFKALAFDRGVNFSAGLPYVRTSPGHGTAYGMAGKGKASEISFRNALYQAIDISKKRQEYEGLTKNALGND